MVTSFLWCSDFETLWRKSCVTHVKVSVVLMTSAHARGGLIPFFVSTKLFRCKRCSNFSHETVNRRKVKCAILISCNSNGIWFCLIRNNWNWTKEANEIACERKKVKKSIYQPICVENVKRTMAVGWHPKGIFQEHGHGNGCVQA